MNDIELKHSLSKLSCTPSPTMQELDEGFNRLQSTILRRKLAHIKRIACARAKTRRVALAVAEVAFPLALAALVILALAPFFRALNPSYKKNQKTIETQTSAYEARTKKEEQKTSDEYPPPSERLRGILQ